MKKLFASALLTLLVGASYAQREKFNSDWTLRLDSRNQWDEQQIFNQPLKKVTLPHDWSIDLPFDEQSPSGNRGASLRGGLGLYEKRFRLDNQDKGKNIFIIFDGVYMNSTVTINGHTLGNRPFGYISFEYDLSPFLYFGDKENVLTVRAENKQPNSRWYSGSGIYRNVWLDKRGSSYVKNWGTFITTPKIENNQATVDLKTEVVLQRNNKATILRTLIYNPQGQLLKTLEDKLPKMQGELSISNQVTLDNIQRWDIESPSLYKAVSEIVQDDKVIHSYPTSFGIRSFHFDQQKGFFLNDKPLKIIGVCMHHDLGALGAAVNVRAMERQLQILKGMGINGIRTSHNPPAPEWLDLCDKMGFIVMDETFDAWTWDKENTPFNYNVYFEKWHKRDLVDHIRRDRNHPSIMMWSIGNEIPEQDGTNGDTIGRTLTRNLVSIIKTLDTTRPVTAGMNSASNSNNLYLSGALDLIGVNYHHGNWKTLGTKLFPGNKPYILSENVSALATRGVYNMPSDSIRRWAGFSKQKNPGNADFTASAYENVSAPWASTNEEALKIFLKYPFLSGMYLWTGFDYLGEPTPYPFPARSSYFGIVDMAGFPKDSYYLYKSFFTKENVLHILPHWNWTAGQKIDVHVYFNNADVVELYLNGKLLGKKSKQGDDLFVRFNGLTYQPGTLKAISRKNGKKVMESVVKTADEAYQLKAELDRANLAVGGEDLSFVKISVLDKKGNLVPLANNLLKFTIKGAGSIAALDNGYQADLTPFSNKESRKAYNGLALAIVRSGTEKGEIELTITGDNLKPTTVKIAVQ
jgi:beta-galactosidase